MSDSEYEEETTYVVFDMGKAVSTEYIQEMKEKTGGCRGLEEGKPYIQIGNLTFEGEVDETIGTHLMFTIEEKQKKQSIEYKCSTETIVKMDSISLETKQKKIPQIKSETVEINDDAVLDAVL
ncbi:hypothetical protein INT48_008410 [Thamnidium elegans]|uniref:Transcription factor TFIIIC triple barrel domain-containing protein n=1 Tax=Thamnidium elegans TaxID=101142 RepID=A0A8H7VNZ4_9FUNG|nr:hypothetical protein INT48_008410 [Thamnidium elegans]